jgi:uncharacterized protein YjhX (UPF0386 family)
MPTVLQTAMRAKKKISTVITDGYSIGDCGMELPHEIKKLRKRRIQHSQSREPHEIKKLRKRRIQHSQSREPHEIKKLRKRPLIKTKFFVLSKHYNPCL